MPKPNPKALTCRHGRYQWTDWQVVPVQFADLARGWGVRATCDYGDHWLWLIGDVIERRVVPFAWPSAETAEAAREAYERQERTSEP